MRQITWYQQDVTSVADTTDTMNVKEKRHALTVQANKMKECTAEPNEHKCINCIAYNRHNKREKINENHSALNKNCPSIQAVLTKYR